VDHVELDIKEMLELGKKAANTRLNCSNNAAAGEEEEAWTASTYVHTVGGRGQTTFRTGPRTVSSFTPENSHGITTTVLHRGAAKAAKQHPRSFSIKLHHYHLPPPGGR